MRIGIIDAYHDSDRGGAGILAGLINIINEIKNANSLDLKISVFYRVSKQPQQPQPNTLFEPNVCKLNIFN